MLKSSINKTKDEPISLITLAYNRDLTGVQETNDEYLEKLMRVSKRRNYCCQQKSTLRYNFLINRE